MLFDHRYMLHEMLGKGGMGIVYRATDCLTGTMVALKRVLHASDEMLLSTYRGDENLEFALAKEFETLASLRHPNIISVLDYGFDDQRYPYFTMDFLPEAETIVEAAGPEPLHEKIDLVIQLLEALTYLHRRGVLHRDLKPANVLVVDGKVRLVDFGLAVRSHDQTEITGTIAYIAPEVLQGKAPNVVSDLYAIGVILYELLVGQHPFNISNIQILISEILGTPPDLNAILKLGETTRLNFGDVLRHDTDETLILNTASSMLISETLSDEQIDVSAITHRNLAVVVGRLLSKTPEDRFQTTEDAIHALQSAIGIQPAPQSDAVRDSFLQAATFVGREDELSTLDAALNEVALSGKGSIWLVGGESGVGKSRLLDELRIHALVRGCLVLRGQGVSDAGMPYQFWREPLRRLILATRIDPTEAGILQELVPDIGALLDEPPATLPALEGNAAQQRLLDTIASLFSRISRPTLLLLEDLQWAIESLDVLKHLTTIVSDVPLLLVGSYRTEEEPDLPDQIAGANSIILNRLNKQHTKELSYSMLGMVGLRPEIVSFLYDQTEGNAFFVVEIVRALAEEAGRLENIGSLELPEKISVSGIHDVLQRRLSSVSAKHRPMLKVAAVVGRRLDLNILRHIIPDFDVDAWLVVCSNATVLDIADGHWRFSHDKLRDTMLSEIEANNLAALHRQVAVAIEDVYASELKERAAQLAHHWSVAGDTAKERHYVLIAARQVEQLGDFYKAEAYYERVKELLGKGSRANPELANVEYELARIKRWTQPHEQDAATPYLERAMKLAQVADDQETIAKIYAERSRLAVRSGDYQTALKDAEKSLAMFQALDNPLELAQAYNAVGNVEFRLANYDRVVQCMEESLKWYQVAGYTLGIATTYMNLGATVWSLGDKQKALEYQKQSLQSYRELGSRHHICTNLHNLAIISSDAGDYEQAKEYYQEALALARDMRSLRNIEEIVSGMGWLNIRLGDFDEAERCLLEALESSQHSGNIGNITSILNDLGDLEFVQGDFKHAASYYEQSIAQSRAHDEKWQLANGLRGLANARIKLGQMDHVQKTLSEALAIAQETDTPTQIVEIGFVIAQLALAIGNHHQAVTLLEALAESESLEAYWRKQAQSLRETIEVTVENDVDIVTFIPQVLESCLQID